ncbi:AraC family transcriptional regulator [Vibrio genomosp. F10]|uniref:XRE family transcriptional regulator n=2 Tax=Vibrio genomosp. F10 TaxID=723171 RepID=A0A1B9R269_9VIBR|nr:AraC family transcriptional regulator [Vibrio genomosp. F10]OCH78255.1 XRE family transcriptional regulator [Vibrio genomosp. F10]OEE30800.1 XRE family transcriptional regulator [Vibrio genomosp. F10 str. ZF-129]OEE95559.1 XRE family transcriptional regulator [Vibrio genomosp. F10 str. 9ZD137]OEE98112.1 XRE family transcriptional regulator [Vibrio genomosp. F10 str. 9ZC157]OEF05388.1 XRE family transcriptional regulator [Vibrio genomosp. F10 str. 9ZB36]
MKTLTTAMQAYANTHSLECTEQVIKTDLKGVSFYYSSTSTPRRPLLYQSGIIIMGQGHKRIHLADESVSYGVGDYLVIGVPLPLECEAFSSSNEPLLSLCIDVDLPLLNTLVEKLNTSIPNPGKSSRGLQKAQVTSDLEDACIRLLKCLEDKTEMAIFGKDLVKEIVYRVLTGPQGNTLMGLVQQDSHYARIAKVLSKLHGNFSSPINVDELAQEANMSVSAFHRAFKEVTCDSPMQYVKKVRLDKAKELITIEGKRASEAANLVGYSSQSQFFREFKRHFQLSPSQMT